MSTPPPRARTSLAAVLLALLLSAAHAAPGGAKLTPLSRPPVWTELDPYQKTVTREEFDSRLKALYATTPASLAAFRRYAEEDAGQIVFYADEGKQTPRYRLAFATEGDRRPVPRRKLGQPPLVCLDPGHIGGPWAHMEERFFQMGHDAPVLEAKLNLLACRRIEADLLKAGFRVVWTKKDEEPVTSLRPEDLRGPALLALFDGGHPLSLPPQPLLERQIDVEAEKLFYRTAEIDARARRVAALKPDLTLCIHFNAAPWGSPYRPDFVPRSRLVVFVHGQYGPDEIAYEDERFGLVRKLLEGTAPEEADLAARVAQNLQKAWPDYPPESYQDWPAVRRVGPNPCVYARNLLANRAFPGPVVFVEGPYMNARDAYPRIETGDYDGLRLVDGKRQPSLFAEYGQAVADAVIAYFEETAPQ